MRTVVTVLVLLALSATAVAQELDLFDPNDFIDPRERGAVFREGKVGLSEKGRPFALVRAYGGRVSDYQWRSTATEGNLSFAHVASSFYRGDKQLSVKFTAFHADKEVKLPAYRGTVQIGQYFLSGRLPIGDAAQSDSRISGRILLTWSVEENPFREEAAEPQIDPGLSPVIPFDPPAATSSRTLNHDFGAQADLRLPLPFRIGSADHIDGSIIWMRRRVGEGNYVDRVTYLYRFRQRLRSNGRLQLNAHLGLGTQRDVAWRCCIARAVFTATFTVPYLDTGINFAYAPTYSRSRTERRTRNEVAFYLDRTAIARLGDILRK